ncbi:MAG: hypothetical protein WBN22_14535 [Verrucomicrobiia bacterium]
MRISKLYLVVCAAAICASFTTVRADDNPDQAAARAALEAKLRELSVQPAATNAQTSAPATPAQPTQPAAPAPASATPPPPVAVTPSGASSVAPAQTMAPAPMAPSSDHGLFAPVPPPSGSIPAAMAPEENMPPSTTSAVPTAVQTPAPAAAQAIPMESPQTANAIYPGKELGLKPITAPPLPISPMQQAQLQALLDKYDANIITPEQYQAARTKILAEPQ